MNVKYNMRSIHNTTALQNKLRHPDIGGEDELRIVGSLLRRKSIQKQSRRRDEVYYTTSFSSVAAIKKKKILFTRKTSDLPEDSDEEEQTIVVSTHTPRETTSPHVGTKSIKNYQCKNIGPFILLLGVMVLIFLAFPKVSLIHDFREQNQSSRILRSQEETLHLEDTIAKATNRLKNYNEFITKFQQGNRELLEYHNQFLIDKVTTSNHEENNKALLELKQEGIKKELSNLGKVKRLHERQIRAMMDKIQRDSYRDVFEKFGEGPHSIEFIISSSSEKGNLIPIILELVPLENMPLSVHLFLEQVYHNLWNGILVKKINENVFETDIGRSINEFESLGLSTIHFHEANEGMSNFTSQDNALYACFKDQGPNLSFFNWSADKAVLTSKTRSCFAKISTNENSSIFDTHESIFIERSRIVNLRMHTGLAYTADSSREMKNKHFT